MMIAKAVDAIDVLVDARRPIRLADLAERLGVAKSSVHRLATSLVEVGLVHRDEDGYLSLGHRMLVWSAGTDSTYRLRDVAEPLMQRLRDETGETINLHIRVGVTRVCSCRSMATSPSCRSCDPDRRCPWGWAHPVGSCSPSPLTTWSQRSAGRSPARVVPCPAISTCRDGATSRGS